jgi:hypothetical protein
LIIYGIFKEQCSCLHALRKCYSAATVEEKFSVREFQERINVKDKAILRILQGSKIMLLGDEEELRRL